MINVKVFEKQKKVVLKSIHDNCTKFFYFTKARKRSTHTTFTKEKLLLAG